jgi:hypothetical protein
MACCVYVLVGAKGVYSGSVDASAGVKPSPGYEGVVLVGGEMGLKKVWMVWEVGIV